MRKASVIIILLISLFMVWTIVYAENDIYEKLKKIIKIDKPINIKEKIINAAPKVNSLLSGVKDSALKVTSAIEDEVADQITALSKEGLGEVTDIINDGLPKVISSLKESLEKAPNDPVLLLKLAVAYKFGGEYALAITAAQKVLEIEPDSEEAAMIISQSYQLKGEADKGISFLQTFLEDTMGSPNLRTYLAGMRIDTGDIKKAAQDMELAVKENPRSQELYKSLGEIYTKEQQKGITVFVEGEKIDFAKYNNIEPMLKNGSTLIPIRALAESIGADIRYDSAKAEVMIQAGEKEIILTTNKKTAQVNSKNVVMNEPAQNVNGRILIPLRFISEQLNKEVGWYPYSKYGIISINEI